MSLRRIRIKATVTMKMRTMMRRREIIVLIIIIRRRRKKMRRRSWSWISSKRWWKRIMSIMMIRNS